MELAPLGVAVVTLVAGNVQTQFWQKEDELQLPRDSPYFQIQDTIAAAASGKLIPPGSTEAKDFAQQVKAVTLSRISGLAWRGALAGSVRWISKLVPARMLVSSHISLSATEFVQS